MTVIRLFFFLFSRREIFVKDDTKQYYTARYDTVQYRCSTMQYNTVRYGAIRYVTVIRYVTIQSKPHCEANLKERRFQY